MRVPKLRKKLLTFSPWGRGKRVPDEKSCYLHKRVLLYYSIYLFRALDHASIMANTMPLTAVYCYFYYFYAFDPGG